MRRAEGSQLLRFLQHLATSNSRSCVPSGRGIRNLSEDGRAVCARGGREIRWALMERFVSEKSEGEGFLGVFGDPEVCGWQHFDAWKGGGDLGKDERIASAAAGDNELVDFVFAK